MQWFAPAGRKAKKCHFNTGSFLPVIETTKKQHSLATNDKGQ